MLNTASADAVAGWMLLCCSSALFAVHMGARRPFHSRDHLLRCAREVWAALPASEKAVALNAHTPLSNKSLLKPARTVEERWRADERAATLDTCPDTLDALDEVSAQYLAKFGFACVHHMAGLNGQQMLAALRSRLRNSRKRELRLATQHQVRITTARLEKLLTLPTTESGALILPSTTS